jgi:hypothetical protein
MMDYFQWRTRHEIEKIQKRDEGLDRVAVAFRGLKQENSTGCG